MCFTSDSTAKIQLNDSAWSSDKARGAGIYGASPCQLSSAGVVADVDFVRRVVEMTIRRFIPIALRAAASIHPLAEHKVAMEKPRYSVNKPRPWIARRRRRRRRRRAGRRAGRWRRAGAAGWAAEAAGRAAGWAVEAAGRAAGRAAEAAEVVGCAVEAVGSVAGRAADRAAGSVAGRAAQDKLLSDFAEGVVQVLIEMKAPGCQWLNLVPVDAR